MFWIVYIVITVDTIFCLPGFACRIQKIQKKNHFISIGLRASKTMWSDLFERGSTQSALFS